MFCEGSIASAERMCFCDSCWLVWHLSHGTACEAEQPIVFEHEPLAIVSPECVAVGFVQAAGGCLEAGGEETPLGSADIFREPFAEPAPSDRVSLGPRPLYVDRTSARLGPATWGFSMLRQTGWSKVCAGRALSQTRSLSGLSAVGASPVVAAML